MDRNNFLDNICKSYSVFSHVPQHSVGFICKRLIFVTTEYNVDNGVDDHH